MSKNTHLTLDDRIEIERALRDQISFREIAGMLGKDPTTIAKEVKNHYVFKNNSKYNPCANLSDCKHICDLCDKCNCNWRMPCKQCSHEKCFQKCPDFKEVTCTRLNAPPYVCNGCDNRIHCRLQRRIYDAKSAQKEYEEVRSESRKGIAISSDELERIDGIISPLIKQGQSIHHICANNADEIMLDEKTIYNYISNGALSVIDVDLPRKVRYRARKKKKAVKVDKSCYNGRTYDCYLEYISAYPDVSAVQMDTVEGRKGGKVLLTVHFTNCEFMVAFLRERKTARSVTEVFNQLYSSLGSDLFKQLFPLILTDRGSEFTDPVSIECDTATGEVRSKIFYCDPQRSDQKGSCEVTHEMIRRILPKGSSFDKLTQDDVNLMMSHINSYVRKKLNNRTPIGLFSSIYGESTPRLLNIRDIPANLINLTPNLLKK